MSLVDLFDCFNAKPVTCTWLIDKFLDTFSERISPETELSVSAFNLHLNKKGDFFNITFAARDNIPAFYYRISVIDKQGQKWNTQEGPDKSFKYVNWRNDLVREADELLPDGKLTIYCEIQIFEFSNVECIESRFKNLVSPTQDNQSLLDSGELSDFVVAVGTREFKAHKVILSAHSVLFEKMFEHDMEELRRNRVEITDMSAGACEDMLKFIYTGKVGHLEQHVYELFAAADKYQIDSLKSYCELYLAMSISPSNISTILQFVEQYSLEDLKRKCYFYIIFNSHRFEDKDWIELTALYPDKILLNDLFGYLFPKHK